MKIRILKNVLIEVEKTKLQEVWDKELRQWEELNAEEIENLGSTSQITTYSGDIYYIPNNAFEVLK